MKTAVAVLAAALAHAAAAATTPISAPPSEEIAPGVHLLRGAMLPERGPDGNTVVFETPQALVVIDTNLDHSSGNGRIKAAFPGARVYTTNAIDRALADGGFLARNLESVRPMLEDPKLSDIRKQKVQVFITTMDERAALRPDVVVKQSAETTIAGRAFDLRVTDGAGPTPTSGYLTTPAASWSSATS